MIMQNESLFTRQKKITLYMCGLEEGRKCDSRQKAQHELKPYSRNICSLVWLGAGYNLF